MTRDELEAVIWRELTRMIFGKSTQGEFVDSVLGAADTYSLSVANAVSDSKDATAARRAVLLEATRSTS